MRLRPGTLKDLPWTTTVKRGSCGWPNVGATDSEDVYPNYVHGVQVIKASTHRSDLSYLLVAYVGASSDRFVTDDAPLGWVKIKVREL